MAVAIRSGAPSVFSAVSSATISGTLSGTSQPQAGDVLLIIHCNDWFTTSEMPTPTVGGSTTGVTAVTGGTADAGTSNVHAKAYYYIVPTTGDLTVAVTETGTATEEKNLIVYVLSGVDTTAVIDNSAAGAFNTSSSTSQVAPSVSPISSNAFLICHVNSASTTATYTPPTGMTEVLDTSNAGVMSMSGATLQLSASGATGTKTFTASGAAPAAMLTIPIRTKPTGIAVRNGVPSVFSAVSSATISGTLSGVSQPQAGDVLLIIHCNDWFTTSEMPTPTVGGSTTGVTAITGATADAGTSNVHAKAYYYVVPSTGNLTVAVTETGTATEEKALVVYVLVGADTTTVIDAASNAFNTSSSTSQVAPSVSPTSTTALLICHVNAAPTTATYTPPTGMTEVLDTSISSTMSISNAALQLSASGATGTKTFTASGSAPAAMLSIAVLKAVAATSKSDSDTGSGVDAVSARTISNTDAGSGTDVASTRKITDADTGTGTDSAGSLPQSLSGADTVSVVDSAGTIITAGIPVPKTWTNGDDLTANTLNREWRDTFKWLLRATSPGFSGYNDLGSSLTFTSNVAIAIRVEELKRGNLTHATNDTKVYVGETGWYIGVAQVGVDLGSVTAGATTLTSVVKVNGIVASTGDQTRNTGSLWAVEHQWSLYLNAGDYVELALAGSWTGTAKASTALQMVPLLQLWWRDNNAQSS